MNQSIYLYLELEGPELDIVPLYTAFAKGSCYGSPVGDTYYIYTEEGDRLARTRKQAYFQVRVEYNATENNPLSAILCEFLNSYFYEGSALRDVLAQNRARLWCTVSAEEDEVVLPLSRSAMRKLIDTGLDIDITVMQNRHRIQHN